MSRRAKARCLRRGPPRGPRSPPPRARAGGDRRPRQEDRGVREPGPEPADPCEPTPRLAGLPHWAWEVRRLGRTRPRGMPMLIHSTQLKCYDSTAVKRPDLLLQERPRLFTVQQAKAGARSPRTVVIARVDDDGTPIWTVLRWTVLRLHCTGINWRVYEGKFETNTCFYAAMCEDGDLNLKARHGPGCPADGSPGRALVPQGYLRPLVARPEREHHGRRLSPARGMIARSTMSSVRIRKSPVTVFVPTNLAAFRGTRFRLQREPAGGDRALARSGF